MILTLTREVGRNFHLEGGGGGVLNEHCPGEIGVFSLKRNWKQCLCKILEGQINRKSIVVFFLLANRPMPLSSWLWVQITASFDNLACLAQQTKSSILRGNNGKTCLFLVERFTVTDHSFQVLTVYFYFCHSYAVFTWKLKLGH